MPLPNKIYYTIVNINEHIQNLPNQQFSWRGAMDYINNKLNENNLNLYVKHGSFIENLNNWKKDNCEFVPINPDHIEINSGQLFVLKKYD
tara:strand:+ start:996 stop:1265 length:270 start_codon:yes stop_codon:yes gene_type:complete